MNWGWLLRMFNPLAQRQPGPPPIPAMLVSSRIVSDEVYTELGLSPTYPNLLDAGQGYYYTTLRGWRTVIEYVYQTFPFPASQRSRKDCDFFAFLFKALVEAYYGLNACAWVVGHVNHPTIEGLQGQHAFNLVRTDAGYKLWEPNPEWGIKELFDIDDAAHGYKPEYVLI